MAPATAGVVRFRVAPTHKGPLLAAVGVEGAALTTTVVVPAVLVHPFNVTVTLYIPAAAKVTPAIVGFCKVELKLLGPVHAYVAPATAGVVRLRVAPTHKGPLLEAVGVAGTELTVSVTTFDVALLAPPQLVL